MSSTFFYCDKEIWEPTGTHCKEFVRKSYGDPVQFQMRVMIGRSIVKAFALFTFVPDLDEENYVPKLAQPHDATITHVLAIVQGEMEQCYEDIQNNASYTDCTSVLQRFKETCDYISCGFIAKQVLGMMSTMEVGKNWNSHGATLGASMCQTAALLAHLDNATAALISQDSTALMPQGSMQTGHKRGHSDVSYIEYMTVHNQTSIAMGAVNSYLNHERFIAEGHADKVMEVMNRTLQGGSIPVPRPTRSRTFDFNLTYRGARLLDGECKAEADSADAGILVLHSLGQLAFKDEALAMLTTNRRFTLYKSTLDPTSKKVCTVARMGEKFELGSVCKDPTTGRIIDDTGRGQDSLVLTVEVPNNCIDETNESVMETWDSLRMKMQKFIFATLEIIDIITNEICNMNLGNIAHERQVAFVKGWKEPSYTAIANATQEKTRAIGDQDIYKYCKASMDVRGAAADAAAVGTGFLQ